jgi:glyoxylase-like metal-dependent hydrolase (beta-lactamase superfamily II)
MKHKHWDHAGGNAVFKDKYDGIQVSMESNVRFLVEKGIE